MYTGFWARVPVVGPVTQVAYGRNSVYMGTSTVKSIALLCMYICTHISIEKLLGGVSLGKENLLVGVNQLVSTRKNLVSML